MFDVAMTLCKHVFNSLGDAEYYRSDFTKFFLVPAVLPRGDICVVHADINPLFGLKFMVLEIEPFRV